MIQGFSAGYIPMAATLPRIQDFAPARGLEQGRVTRAEVARVERSEARESSTLKHSSSDMPSW
jgi:hypothetical protein